MVKVPKFQYAIWCSTNIWNSNRTYAKAHIQGVHKVRVHFKKIITLIVFAIEIICKKDLKEENRYFLRFY